MTYQEIFSESKQIIMGYNAKEVRQHIAVEVNIEGEGAGIFYIEIRDGNIYVEPYEYIDHDFKLTLSGRDFLDICGGRLDPVKAFTTGSLQIDRDIDKALELADVFNSIKTVQPEKKEEPEKAKKAPPKRSKKK